METYFTIRMFINPYLFFTLAANRIYCYVEPETKLCCGNRYFDRIATRLSMSFDITQWIVKIPVLLFAITLHEYAHGRVAFLPGRPHGKTDGEIVVQSPYSYRPAGGHLPVSL